MDKSERYKGDGVIVFITQVAAMSWAETQHPETTLASQSLQKTGFRRASQMEVEFVLIGGVPRSASMPKLNSLFLTWKRSFSNWRMNAKKSDRFRSSRIPDLQNTRSLSLRGLRNIT